MELYNTLKEDLLNLFSIIKFPLIIFGIIFTLLFLFAVFIIIKVTIDILKRR